MCSQSACDAAEAAGKKCPRHTLTLARSFDGASNRETAREVSIGLGARAQCIILRTIFADTHFILFFFILYSARSAAARGQKNFVCLAA